MHENRKKVLVLNMGRQSEQNDLKKTRANLYTLRMKFVDINYIVINWQFYFYLFIFISFFKKRHFNDAAAFINRKSRINYTNIKPSTSYCIKTKIICWSKWNIHRDLKEDSEKTAKVIESTATHPTLGKILNKQNA